MSHDKLKAAIRARIAQLMSPISVARRAALNERPADGGETARPSSRWLALRHDANGLNGLTAFLDGVFSLGRPKSGVEVAPDKTCVRCLASSSALRQSGGWLKHLRGHSTPTAIRA